MHDRLLTFVGTASGALGVRVCEMLGLQPGRYARREFPDGEIEIEVHESVRGAHVCVIQATAPPAERHLIELLLLADACRRAGAERLTAVIPYFAYARQDRRTERRALGGRVAADLIATGRFDRVMLIDAHTPAIEGFFDVPIDHLTAVPLLADAAAAGLPGNAVVVAPDFGAVKRARELASRLRLPLALVHKTRAGADTVETRGIVGDVRGRAPLIVDDMISTGATLEAAVRSLQEAGAADAIAVAATHGLFVGQAPSLLQALPLSRLIVTDTVSPDPQAVRAEIASVAPLVATAIRRNHRGESLADLRTSG